MTTIEVHDLRQNGELGGNVRAVRPTAARKSESAHAAGKVNLSKQGARYVRIKPCVTEALSILMVEREVLVAYDRSFRSSVLT